MLKVFRTLVVATSAVTAAFTASGQEVYAGLGLPGLFTIGYSHAMGNSWGLRAQYSGGTNLSADAKDIEGVNATATLKSSTAGIYADWFPFSNSGFRLVGGLASNDTKLEVNAVGTGTATIGNANNVDMTGETYNVAVKFPSTAPYLGLGYGHHKAEKGLGFYEYFGVLIGKPKVSSQTSLVTSGKVSQADVDAQNEKVRDAASKVGVLPVMQLGVVYRF